MKRIHDSLRTVLQRHRLVFWYDVAREWAQAFESFDEAGVTKLVVAGNEFGTKVAIRRNPDRAARYLIYVPSACPPEEENWLLDLLLQGHEYKADRASLALQEVGLPYDFHPLASEHLKFFDATKRAQALQERLETGDQKDDVRSLRLKMMAVLAGAEPNTDALLLHFFKTTAPSHIADPVETTFSSAQLTAYFWAEVKRDFGYASTAPSLRDVAATLFRSSDPLENRPMLNPHARVFMRHWQNSRDASPAFVAWAEHLEEDLRISQRLDELQDARVLGRADAYPAFEKFTLRWLYRAFERGTSDAQLPSLMQDMIDARRESFWFARHKDGYEALTQALILRELIAAAEIKLGSVEGGVLRYAEHWQRIDTAYRKFCFHQRKYGQVALLESVVAWVERTYLNNFLLPLSDAWGDQVRQMPRWRSDTLLAQTRFFDHYLRPFTAKKQKVFVVISDALRYEAAAELAVRLRAENRWSAELEPMLGMLPSYTQLGMAALLPGDERSLNPADGMVSVDGRTATGTAARKAILAGASGLRATAITAEEFLEMGAKTTARALLREHDVVFIYHNAIDKIGDDVMTEARTAEAVEKAFDELQEIVRKIYSANGYNILITADHGFLFQQSDVDSSDDQPLPRASEWLLRNRRYAIGREIAHDPAVKIFSAAELGLSGDWQAAFPLGLGRFPLQGSGKRYVHGGPSLQEVVLPVLHVHVARVDDTTHVEIDLLRTPNRITTGQLTLSLYQDKPVSEKLLARTLRVGVFAPDGTALSEMRTLIFDAADAEPRQRETTVGLTLSRTADAYHNHDVEIRLEEALGGTTHLRPYKSHRVKLIKPFANDFDTV